MAKPTTRDASTRGVDTAPEQEASTAAKGPRPLAKLESPVTALDDRVGLAALGRKNLRKVFPDHWSFLLGEVALYSFIICLITGVFLTIWFRPSMAEITYDGSYQLLKGLHMSEAFASTLEISFDIKGGLLIRQLHHWGALLFVAAMFAHMMRVFFTGAFRKPRELNWLLGVGLISMGAVEGFAGYSLPDDLLSGTGLRFADGMIRSFPLIGTWAEFFVFGGEYPGELIISRLYMVHILLLPGLLLGLVAAHMALVVYHKHTQFPGPGRTEKNVVGYPMFPVYMAKAGGFFFIVSGVLVLMATFMQINPLWQYGPYNPAQVTAGSQPDFYMGAAEGGVRIMPPWETYWFGLTWSWNIFIPGVGILGALFTGMALYPFIERWVTGDKEEHHLLQLPHQAPTRTAIGVAAIAAYFCAQLGGANDLMATHFELSLNAITWFLRIMIFVSPIVAFLVTKRICVSLQRRDNELLTHGSPSGDMERLPDGGYFEHHVNLSDDEAFTLSQHREHVPVEASPSTDAHGVRTKGGVSKNRARWSRFFYETDALKPSAEEIAEGRAHTDHENAEHGHGELTNDDGGEHDDNRELSNS